jgi:gamma-glutamyltranspeptidase/glutathione hydrolase
MKNGRPYAALGTPGSDGQVQTNLQLISNLLDHDIPVQAVIEAPRWRRSPEGELSIEDRFSPNTLAELERRGHQLKNVGGWSDKMGGAQAIVVHPTSGVFMGGADPRREGYAVGW